MSGLALILTAAVLPWLLDWDVHARSAQASLAGVAPPLHGFFDPRIGICTLGALAWAVLAVRTADPISTLPWPRLLTWCYVAGLVWMLLLALTDGPAGIARVFDNPHEYLETARSVHSVPDLLDGYVERIPQDAADHWVTHVAGHPPGALLFFVGLVRLGLGSGLAAGMVVMAIAATTPLAVLTTLRELGAEATGRRVAALLTFSPAVLFMAVSADAMFAAVTAWGAATLAIASTRTRPAVIWGWGLTSGLLLGMGIFLSYGLGLFGVIAVGVLLAARSWRALLPTVLGAWMVVGAFALGGFYWWEAFPVLRERYWDGLAAQRPGSYWMWANLAALLIAAGPLVGAGLGRWAGAPNRVPRPVGVLVASALVAVLLADLSQMSRAEVERIWLPFLPWLTLATAALDGRWLRLGLAAQLAWAIAVETLFYTTW